MPVSLLGASFDGAEEWTFGLLEERNFDVTARNGGQIKTGSLTAQFKITLE